ncbi:MAG: glycosyltransferase [Planctomycetales bacterium]|nr:glycosyltransferase [Planctomycetales bacterium]
MALSRNSKSLAALMFTAFGRIGQLGRDQSLAAIRLMHAHFAPDAVLALPIAEYLGVPLVTTCHGSDITVSDWNIFRAGKISGLRYLLQRKDLLSYGARFIAVSDFLKQRMIDAGYPADKVVRHYVGVDTTRFVPLEASRNSVDHAPYVLSVARHSDVKGLDTLIKAFARVVARHPELRLVQIGDGELMPRLKSLAADHGLEDRIEFLGARRPQDVLWYMQRCRLLVLSSRRSLNGAEESFGLVLAEAAACGIPCVATLVGGIPEAVVAGQTGCLVPPDDVGALSDAIDGLIGCPDLAAAMGRRAREMVRDCFDLHRQTGQLERIYDEVA